MRVRRCSTVLCSSSSFLITTYSYVSCTNIENLCICGCTRDHRSELELPDLDQVLLCWQYHVHDIELGIFIDLEKLIKCPWVLLLLILVVELLQWFPIDTYDNLDPSADGLGDGLADEEGRQSTRRQSATETSSSLCQCFGGYDYESANWLSWD